MPVTGICPTCAGPTPLGKNGRHLKWCSDDCRRDFYRQPCPDCGSLMNGSEGRGPNAPKLCVSCSGKRTGALERQRWSAYSADRDKAIIEMMSHNATNREIGEMLGYTTASVGQFIVRLRRKGAVLPERHGKRKPSQNGTKPNFG